MMARKIRAKAKSPEAIAAEKLLRRAQDFLSVGLPAEAAALPAHDEVQVRRESRASVQGARRADVFDVLRDGMQPGAYDAARRLEQDMLIRRGEGDRGRAMSRVDSQGSTDRSDEMLAAGERVDAVLARVGERDAWLLRELIDPSPASKLARPTWRLMVAYVTGEDDPMAQGAVVRAACANLKCAYDRTGEGRRFVVSPEGYHDNSTGITHARVP